MVPPALIWLRRQPEDMGLRPDGDDFDPAGSSTPDDSQQPVGAEVAEDEVSWTAREAYRTPALRLLLASEICSGMSLGGLIVHRIPYITDQGFSNVVAGVTFVTYSVCAFLPNSCGATWQTVSRFDGWQSRPYWAGQSASRL